MSGIFKKKRKFHDEPQRPENVVTVPVPRPVEPPVAFEVPSPVPAPQSPAEPAPAPRAKAWPHGAHEFVPGAWYVGSAGPFSKPEEYWEWVEAVRRRDENLRDETKFQSPGRGTVPAGSLSKNDAAYIYYRSHDYRLAKHNGDLFRDLCSGSHHDIARAIQLGDVTNPGMNPCFPDNLALPGLIDNLFAAR